MTGYNYPLRMGRIILQALEEILGREGLHSILKQASLGMYAEAFPPARPDKKFPFASVSGLMASLEQAYGPQGGRGTALRVGRACFQYGLREYGLQLGITELAYRLLPLPMKLRFGARAFADLFNKHTDQKVRIEETEGKLFWHIDRCPVCWERHASDPVCQLAVGLLQESLYWLSGGRNFNVEETACMARGEASCTIQIDLQPFS